MNTKADRENEVSSKRRSLFTFSLRRDDRPDRGQLHTIMALNFLLLVSMPMLHLDSDSPAFLAAYIVFPPLLSVALKKLEYNYPGGDLIFFMRWMFLLLVLISVKDPGAGYVLTTMTVVWMVWLRVDGNCVTLLCWCIFPTMIFLAVYNNEKPAQPLLLLGPAFMTGAMLVLVTKTASVLGWEARQCFVVTLCASVCTQVVLIVIGTINMEKTVGGENHSNRLGGLAVFVVMTLLPCWYLWRVSRDEDVFGERLIFSEENREDDEQVVRLDIYTSVSVVTV